jgi:hypothetical protein
MLRSTLPLDTRKSITKTFCFFKVAYISYANATPYEPAEIFSNEENYTPSLVLAIYLLPLNGRHLSTSTGTGTYYEKGGGDIEVKG